VKDGPLSGLSARARLRGGQGRQGDPAEYVKDISQEPNYEAALAGGQEGGG
jgi:hypothetical protein